MTNNNNTDNASQTSTLLDEATEQKDEFTTAMHADMLGWSEEDTILMKVYAEILRGTTKLEACNKYDITVDYYDKNIDAALKRC